jgi:hypothetical protein
MNRKKRLIIAMLALAGVGLLVTGFSLPAQGIDAGKEQAAPSNSSAKEKKTDRLQPILDRSLQSITTFNLILIFILKFMCLVFGFWTIYLGYDLLKRGVKGEFKFSAKLSGGKADLVSASPGLLFVLLGIILIGFALYVKKDIPIRFSVPNGPVKPDSTTAPIPTEDEWKENGRNKNE